VIKKKMKITYLSAILEFKERILVLFNNWIAVL